MESRGARTWTHCLQAYYLLTPAFFLLDWSTGINLRASYFDNHPALNIAYYGMAFTCGIVCMFFQRATILIGLGESVLNIVLLCVGYMSHYVAALDGVMEDKPDVQQHIDALQGGVNFMISAFILGLSFYFNPFMRHGPAALANPPSADR